MNRPELQAAIDDARTGEGPDSFLLDGVTIRVKVLRPDQAVFAGRVLRQDPAVNCNHPGCFRVQPAHSLFCQEHCRSEPQDDHVTHGFASRRQQE